MSAFARWTTTFAALAALLVALPAASAAQEETGDAPDLEEVTAQMELSQEARAEVAKLGDLLERRAEIRGQMTSLRSDMQETMQGLMSTLTVDQFHQIRAALHPDGMKRGHGMKGRGMRGHGMRGHGMRGMHRGHGMRGEGGPGRGMMHGPGMGMRMGDCPMAPDADAGDGEESS